MNHRMSIRIMILAVLAVSVAATAPPVYAQTGGDGRASSELSESALAADIKACIDAGMDPHSISGG